MPVIPVDKALEWFVVVAPVSIALLATLDATSHNRETFFRGTLKALSLSGVMASSLFLAIPVAASWGMSEIGDGYVASAVEIGVLIILYILAVFGILWTGKRVATDVAEPLWLPSWGGSMKEKTTRLFFQLILLWFLIGSVVNLANFLLEYSLLGLGTWMESLAWTVFIPALGMWFFSAMVRNTREKIRERKDSANAL